MIWVLLGVLVAAEAAKLDNTYLPPPPNAKESGGSDGALQVPLEPPYVDQYNSGTSAPPLQKWKPGTRSISKPSADNQFLENEDEIKLPALEKGRFISGSYSYTGPDNVLVTVTYKADNRKGREEDTEENDEDSIVDEEDDEEEDAAKSRNLAEEEEEEVEEDDDSIVPTPPTLPAELARAFDFHKKKQLREKEEGKTNRPKRPLKKVHNKKKGQHGHRQETDENVHGNYGTKTQSHHQGSHGGDRQGTQGVPSYQYPPPHQYGPPTIHQGYSYPKQY